MNCKPQIKKHWCKSLGHPSALPGRMLIDGNRWRLLRRDRLDLVVSTDTLGRPVQAAFHKFEL